MKENGPYTTCEHQSPIHYEDTPIQIYWKFHHQKLKVFRYKFWYFLHKTKIVGTR